MQVESVTVGTTYAPILHLCLVLLGLLAFLALSMSFHIQRVVGLQWVHHICFLFEAIILLVRLFYDEHGCHLLQVVIGIVGPVQLSEITILRMGSLLEFYAKMTLHFAEALFLEWRHSFFLGKHIILLSEPIKFELGIWSILSLPQTIHRHVLKFTDPTIVLPLIN